MSQDVHPDKLCKFATKQLNTANINSSRQNVSKFKLVEILTPQVFFDFSTESFKQLSAVEEFN